MYVCIYVYIHKHAISEAVMDSDERVLAPNRKRSLAAVITAFYHKKLRKEGNCPSSRPRAEKDKTNLQYFHERMRLYSQYQHRMVWLI